MSTLPASGYLSNSARTAGEMKAALDDLRDVVAQLPGGTTDTELTIASGSVTPTLGHHRIDTEADAATDDLSNIVQTNFPDGSMILIRAENTARDVVVKHNAGGAGEILLRGGIDFTMDELNYLLILIRRGTTWVEVTRRGPYTKITTGDATGEEGLSVINTADNNFKVYAEGVWRSLATW